MMSLVFMFVPSFPITVTVVSVFFPSMSLSPLIFTRVGRGITVKSLFVCVSSSFANQIHCQSLYIFVYASWNASLRVKITIRVSSILFVLLEMPPL